MNEQAKIRTPAVATATLALLASLACGCGGSVVAGVAVGKMARGLEGRAHTIPQGAEVCALQDALAAPAAGAEKPTSDACGKAASKDVLWRKALVALAAYGHVLEALASGASADTTGPLEGALTGVHGTDWVDVEAPDQPARDAVGQLVGQLAAAKGDLGARIRDAAAPVKTLCEGLSSYFDAQGHALGEIQKEIDKKRVTRADRRCGQLDGRNLCVSESVIDRVVYGNTFGAVTILERSSADARDAVAGFCAAHRKLEEAAADGRLSRDKTYFEIVDAVKAAPRAQVGSESKPTKAATPPKK